MVRVLHFTIAKVTNYTIDKVINDNSSVNILFELYIYQMLLFVNVVFDDFTPFGVL